MKTNPSPKRRVCFIHSLAVKMTGSCFSCFPRLLFYQEGTACFGRSVFLQWGWFLLPGLLV